MFRWLARLFGLQSPVRSIDAADGTCAEAIAQPVAGVENSVPWPYPPPAGAQALTFRGSGNATTGTFSLDGDAALRIVTEGSPITLKIKRADGTFLAEAVELPDGGHGLMAIPEGGVYSFVIESSARWGVTALWPPPLE
jgi:hypothetical protein